MKIGSRVRTRGFQGKLNKALKKIRAVEKFKTLGEMALHMGVDGSQLSRWCNNLSVPSAQSFLNILNGYPYVRPIFIQIDLHPLGSYSSDIRSKDNGNEKDC